ncbi:type I toxin-antitoxin system SymE family toxin [Jejubacter calystegiae]|uniref:Type I toxin-antitoxin system SymE family toxin n=1 Tax=Jejubacter calystegiae TaxID=2579935 RepID=A0A4P8YJP9_9ENTR|nr:SymE family type I addiction module toxin [Jejubacter calystegiae]QCT20981.1 type I toxin-antitoxin system SymE family toxin [Jejubacter calystegiae]
MADTHHNPHPAISKTQRNLTVGYIIPRHENSLTCKTTYYDRSPSLHLKGHWLGEAGFETGGLVKVHIEPGRIMICPV